jgi:hypothetical protein
MHQSQGYAQNPSLVYRINKSMYGLKQEPTTSYEKMDSYLLSQGFIHCKYDTNVYMLKNIDFVLIIVLYVDELLIIGSSVSTIIVVNTSLHGNFSMIDM